METKIGYLGLMVAHFGFDTLSFVKRLAAAGMDSRQAEALAEALNDNAFESLATKADLKELGSDLRAEISATRADLRDLGSQIRAEMRDFELRMYTKLGATIAAATALIVAILGVLVTQS